MNVASPFYIIIKYGIISFCDHQNQQQPPL